MAGRSQAPGRYHLNEKSVSRDHFEIKRSEDGGEFTLTDLESTNGTYRNGKRLDFGATVTLKNGDHIKAGDIILEFKHR